MVSVPPPVERLRVEDIAGVATVATGTLGGLETLSAPHTEAAIPKVGTALGRYRLERELGRGGMGVVFTALDPELDRPVAIKLMLHRGGAEEIARLSREAQAVAQLSHPNVVGVFDIGVSDGRPYIVMEYIPGVTLSAWLVDRRPWRHVVRTFIDAAYGLQAAHAAGLVHRDFKPANVLIDERGTARVLDFGLARSPTLGAGGRGIASDTPLTGSTLTATGVALGTPPFMSPEQHRGDPLTLATDVYAFGVSLYRALFGVLPFAGRSVGAVLSAKRRGVPSEPAQDVPPALYEIVKHTLAFAPEARYPSMAPLIADLRAVVGDTKRRWSWALAGVSVVALGAALTMSPSDGATPMPAADATVVIDTEAANATRALVERSEQSWRAGKVEESLGYAYGSLLLAASSGSDAARAVAQAAFATGLSRLLLHDLAEPELRLAVTLAVDAGEGRTATLAAIRLATTLFLRGDLEEAIESARFARALSERFGLESDAGVQTALLSCEAAPLASSDPKRGIELLERAVELARPAELDDQATLAVAIGNLSHALMAGEPERALALALESRAILAAVFSHDHLGVAESELLVASALSELGRTGESAPLAAAALERTAPHNVSVRARLAATAADAYAAQGEFERARILVDEAVSLGDQSRGLNPMQRLNLHLIEGAIFAREGHYDKAEQIFQQALALSESTETTTAAELANLLFTLGEIVRFQGDLERARPYYERAITIANTPNTQQLHQRAKIGLGILLFDMHDYVAAEQRLSAVLLAELDDDGRDLLSRAMFYRASAMWEIGDARPEAIELARDALQRLETRHAAGPGREVVEDWLRNHQNQTKSGKQGTK